MVSRENKVILAFMALIIPFLYAAAELNLPLWVGTAIIIGIGVIAPLIVNEYLDNQSE